MTDTGLQAKPTPDQILSYLKAQQNFSLAVLAGLAAAAVGAVGWAVITFVTEMEIGFAAVAVGALVGYAIRITGKGVEQKFGVLGAICAGLGWGLGTALSDVAFAAKAVDRPFLDVLANLGADGAMSLMSRAFSPMDFLFLAIAVYEGYKFAFLYRLKR